MEFFPYSNLQVFFPTPLFGLQQVPPLPTFTISKAYNPSQAFSMESFITVPSVKHRVVFVLGSTGTGKSKLAINLASHFGGEVVNSDKMQVYDGLNVITNKVTDDEQSGIPHHLIGGVHHDADFTVDDFRYKANHAVESILASGRLPIIAGGSNSYIEALVNGDEGEFRSKYNCCFIWVDVDMQVLHSFVRDRVDMMVKMGLVEEARGMFHPDGYYCKGIRRSIGVPEMDRYFRSEATLDEEAKAMLLGTAIEDIKVNTCKLTCYQLQKIHRLQSLEGWDVHRVDATKFFLRRQENNAAEIWDEIVRIPSIKIVQEFLNTDDTIKNTADISNETTDVNGATLDAAAKIQAVTKENCALATAAAIAVATTAIDVVAMDEVKAPTMVV